MDHTDAADDPGYPWTPADPSKPRRHPGWVLPALVVPIVGLIVANNIGAVLFTDSLQRATGLVENPVRVLALNSTNKFLLATGFQVDWLWFLTVPLLRLLAPDPLFYLLGYLYRAPALKWGRSVYPGSDRLFDLFEHEDHRGVHRLLDALVVVMPNNPVCLMAGVGAMPWRRFAVLNVIGTLGRLVVFRLLSVAFEDQILSVTDFIARYQRWAFWITIVAVVVSLMVFARRVVSSTEQLAEEDA